MAIFGSKSNPANAAMPYLNQIGPTMSPYYQPYINQGQQSLGMLSQQYGEDITNPGGVMSSIGAGYQASPGYEWQVQQGTEAGNNAAAAGGYVGTPMHQQQQSEMEQGIANQDYYNYLNHALGIYKGGLQGESGLNQMGYNASNELAQSLAQALMSQAGLAYSGQENQNQSQRGLLGGLVGAGLGGYQAYKYGM